MIAIRRDKDRVHLKLTNPYHPEHQHRQGNRIALANIRERVALPLIVDAGRMDAETFRARYGIETGYITASNAWFEKIATVPARYNRIIFYEGTLFHSGEIAHPELLSRDPRAGRLSLNGFFTCRRNLAPT